LPAAIDNPSDQKDNGKRRCENKNNGYYAQRILPTLKVRRSWLMMTETDE